MFDFYSKVQKELSQFETGGLDEEKIQAEVAEVEKRLTQKARKLHLTREKVAHSLEEQIKQELADLYMEKLASQSILMKLKPLLKRVQMKLYFSLLQTLVKI